MTTVDTSPEAVARLVADLMRAQLIETSSFDLSGAGRFGYRADNMKGAAARTLEATAKERDEAVATITALRDRETRLREVLTDDGLAHELSGAMRIKAQLDAWSHDVLAPRTVSDAPSGKAPMRCPHCNAVLLWSEDRGAHCDSCDTFDPEIDLPKPCA